MDQRMPDMDGTEATRILKDDPRTGNIPVVSWSASVMREDQDQIQSLGDGILKKPASKGQMIQELCRFLPHQRLEVDSEERVETTLTDAWSPGSLSPDELARLPELVDLLEGELRTEWEALRATMTINEIEDFANRMQTLGKEYGYPPLASWGESMQTQASMFQLDALPRTMAEYPQLIERIRS
jgi:CheY-like chemotaxis protein